MQEPTSNPGNSDNPDEGQPESQAVLIIEQRQPLSDILSDLLRDAGYVAVVAQDLARAFQLAGIVQVSVIVANLDMFGREPDWLSYQFSSNINTLNIQSIFFYTANPALVSHRVLLARSPADFARVVNHVQRLLQVTIPQLGELLVRANYIKIDDLSALVDIQAMLRKIGRQMPLGELMVRLGFVTQQQINDTLMQQMNIMSSGMQQTPKKRLLTDELLNDQLSRTDDDQS